MSPQFPLMEDLSSTCLARGDLKLTALIAQEGFYHVFLIEIVGWGSQFNLIAIIHCGTGCNYLPTSHLKLNLCCEVQHLVLRLTLTLTYNCLH